MYIEQEE